MEEAAGLARRAAESACEHLSGKPLFAGHASLPWPDDPLLVLWHAQTLLREFRGDIHIAAMTAEGIDGCEALVTHAATGDITREMLQGSRFWSDDQWDAAVESLRAKGHLDAEGSFTDKGAESRQRVEDQTDAGALVAYAAAGRRGLQATAIPVPTDVPDDRRGRPVQRTEVDETLRRRRVERTQPPWTKTYVAIRTRPAWQIYAVMAAEETETGPAPRLLVALTEQV